MPFFFWTFLFSPLSLAHFLERSLFSSERSLSLLASFPSLFLVVSTLSLLRWGYESVDALRRVVRGYKEARLPLEVVWSDIGK